MLRLVAAVFAAAFIGNMYYHLLQAKEQLIGADWHKTLVVARCAL